MFDGPVRGGNRGGHTDFKWSDVSADKDREHYLGHSINAPTGRWQKNKDVHWYNRDLNDTEEARQEELRKIKEAEAEALSVALGFKPEFKLGQITATTENEPKPHEIEAAKEARKREKEDRRKRKEEKRLLKEIKRSRRSEKARLKGHPENLAHHYPEEKEDAFVQDLRIDIVQVVPARELLREGSMEKTDIEIILSAELSPQIEAIGDDACMIQPPTTRCSMPLSRNTSTRHSQRRNGKSPSSTRHRRRPAAPKPHRILTLPPEILSYIFELGNFLSETGPDDAFNPFPHFAMVCSHVNQHFRNVALSTPILWTYIDFREGFPYDTAHAFLERSKEAPLSLDVDLTTGSEPHSAGRDDHRYIVEDMIGQSMQIHSMIAPHVHRWKDFELKADYYEIIWYWLLELAKERSAPYLENLGFFCHEDWKSSEEFQPRELRGAMAVFTGGTPRIKSVDLWGVHFDWNAVTILRGLRTLRLAWHTRDVGLTATQFTQALKECPDLHELSLQQSGPLIGTWPGDRINLAHLKILELAYLDLDIAIEIFRHVQFPVLEELSLDLEQDSVEPFIEAFASSCRSYTTVRSLKLRSFQCTPSKARLFLLRMPNLTFMNLNFHYLTSSFGEVLMHRHHPVCTKLNTLKLSGLGMGKLRNLLRCRPTNSITTLHLDETDDWDKSEIRQLNKAVKLIQFYTSSDDEDVDEEEEGSEESEVEDDDNSGQSVYNVGDYLDFDMYDNETNYYD